MRNASSVSSAVLLGFATRNASRLSAQQERRYREQAERIYLHALTSSAPFLALPAHHRATILEGLRIPFHDALVKLTWRGTVLTGADHLFPLIVDTPTRFFLPTGPAAPSLRMLETALAQLKEPVNLTPAELADLTEALLVNSQARERWWASFFADQQSSIRARQAQLNAATRAIRACSATDDLGEEALEQATTRLRSLEQYDQAITPLVAAFKKLLGCYDPAIRKTLDDLMDFLTGRSISKKKAARLASPVLKACFPVTSQSLSPHTIHVGYLSRTRRRR